MLYYHLLYYSFSVIDQTNTPMGSAVSISYGRSIFFSAPLTVSVQNPSVSDIIGDSITVVCTATSNLLVNAVQSIA